MTDNTYTFTFSPETMELARQKIREHAEIPILSDSGFKMQLSKGTKASNHCLKRLLSAITGKTVTEVQILNSEITPEFFNAKHPRLDIYCSFDDGQKADIELQMTKEADLEAKRAVYYASKLYAGNLIQGDEYRDIKNVYQIFMTNFTVFKDEKFIHNFQMNDGNIILTDSLQIIFVELSKTRELISEWDLRNLKPLEFWCILYTCDRKGELYQKLHAVDTFREDLLMFEKSINEISQDEKAWAMQLSIEGGILDYNSAMGSAERRGEARAKLESAVIAVKDFGIDIEAVAGKFEVPLEKLKEALNN